MEGAEAVVRRIGGRIAAWTLPGTRSGTVALSAAVALACILAGTRLQGTFSAAILPGGDWRIPGQHLVDFRDLIYGPGRFLLSGGNPYNPSTYLPTAPGAQEFDLYAPAWLWLSAGLGWLPYFVGGAIYEVLGLAALVALCAIVVRMAAVPRAALLGTLLFCYLLVWYPSRTAAENGSSLFITLGVLVALGLVRQRPWLAAAGLALAMIKPQFGVLLLLFLLFMRGWQVVWKGVVLLVAASAPPLLWCVVNAGGVGGFVDSLVLNLAQASSPGAATGLGNPQQIRIDLLGAISRMTGSVPADALQIVIPLILIGITCAVVHRSPDLLATFPLIATAILLAIVHLPYDLVLMVAPAMCLTATLLRRSAPNAFQVVATICAILLLGHIHRVDQIILPGVGETDLNTIDTALLAMCWLSSAISNSLPRRRRDESGNSSPIAPGQLLPSLAPRPRTTQLDVSASAVRGR